jgi:hypothetical protein
MISFLKKLGVLAIFILFFAPMSFAGKDCSFFTVTIGNQVYTPGPKGDAKITLTAAQVNGKTALVRGTFVEFDVDLNTFTVRNHTLTGVAAPDQITTQRTKVFGSKVPNANLTGKLVMRIRVKGQNLVMERGGSKVDMKIQAKDCDQGGLFQMEPEPTTTETNTLAAGFKYCFQASPISRRFFTNGIVLGYDSPQDATFVSGNNTTAVWSVQDGGRIGMVVGEDAVEALRLEGTAAQAACPHQTP